MSSADQNGGRRIDRDLEPEARAPELPRIGDWFTGGVLPWGDLRFECQLCNWMFDFSWPVQQERLAFTLSLHITQVHHEWPKPGVNPTS